MHLDPLAVTLAVSTENTTARSPCSPAWAWVARSLSPQYPTSPASWAVVEPRGNPSPFCLKDVLRDYSCDRPVNRASILGHSAEMRSSLAGSQKCTPRKPNLRPFDVPVHPPAPESLPVLLAGGVPLGDAARLRARPPRESVGSILYHSALS